MQIQKEIIQNFLYLEKKYNLFDLKINNIYFYQLIRMGLYYYITEKKNFFSNQPKLSYNNKIKLTFLIIKEMLSFNKRSSLLKKKICIIPHPRQINNRDIYTDLIKKIFKESAIIHQTANQNFDLSKDSINYDYFNFIKKIKYLITIKFNKKKNTNIENITNIFKKKFKLSNEFDQFIYNLIINKIYSLKIAHSFLKKSKFKHIILVNSYGNNHFVYAANQLNIKTTELQHGVINKNHLGYHYPSLKKKKIESFPDKLLVYGKIWALNANFPINQNDIIPLGFPNLELANKKKLKKNNKILILSQKTIQKYLLEFCKKIVSKNNKVFFTYKAHPKEDLDYVKNFLDKHKIRKNFKIVDGKENIYKYFSTHKIQIGVFSTAIFEGYSFNLKTFVLKAPGWEGVKILKKFPNVFFISQTSEFFSFLSKKNLKFKSCFFEKNARKNFLGFFKKNKFYNE